MANEFYTLIVVPHAKARFRKLQVSVRLTKWILACGAALVLLLVGVLIHYSVLSVQVAEIKKLRSENLTLAAKAQAYEQNAGNLQAKLLSVQTMVNKLGVMAGLEKSIPDSTVGGVGGLTGMETRPPTADLAQSLDGMDRALATLTDKSSKLEEFYKDQQVLLASTPSIWPARGYLSASFGNRVDPFTGQIDFHSGIDISTPLGTPIVSPADGVVVGTGTKGAYGNMVEIDHGFGLMTRYGHMASFAVKGGQRIRRGEVIGYVGVSGRTTGPHVHYEVWVKDQARNPIEFILDEYRSFG